MLLAFAVLCNGRTIVVDANGSGEFETIQAAIVDSNNGDIIEVPDLPELCRFSALRKTGFTRTLAEVEAEYISNVLAEVDGNKTRAAEILGIDRKTLREKLKKVEQSLS